MPLCRVRYATQVPSPTVPSMPSEHPCGGVRPDDRGYQAIHLRAGQSGPRHEPNTRADKIGDAVSFGNGEFLVVERDDDSLSGDDPSAIEKKIYRFNLAGATDVSTFTGPIGTTGKTMDQLTVTEMLCQ